ncbi:uncharacterized protein N7482_010290 [Penicillium canariense]|uniref:Uncharacterized protein n=1 Tax=Penicillium canariense TaxID=189055 RepID=A0A9W9HJJ1_9EURO|nr:uncharacterized protein N7482_010290 [Penicillium canariense]KAJ5151038.1 hypothetical protein N7482_010290 [Penicillium canariense]
MQYRILFTAFVFGLGTTALASLPPTNSKWAQLRLYGSPGCDANNLLELGVYGSQKNTCISLDQYGAIEAVNITSIFDECELYLYEDAGCAVEERIGISGCVSGDSPYKGLVLACDV